MTAPTPARARALHALVPFGLVLALMLLAPGARALAAAPSISLSAGAGRLATFATATVYGDGLAIRQTGGEHWYQLWVTDVAAHQLIESCPGPGCTTGYNAYGYLVAATVTGLQARTTYQVTVNEIPPQYGYLDATFAPELTTGPLIDRLTLNGPAGSPSSGTDQIGLTLRTDTVQDFTWTLTQERLGPAGAQVPFAGCPSGGALTGGDCQYTLAVPPDGSATLTTANQRAGGPGYTYRYVATAGGYTTDAVLFANGPTFYVHRRTRGLFVTWPDVGDGTRYDVFGGPGSGGCSAPTFNSSLLPAGTTQWAATGLSPNTPYAVCMWAEIAGQPVTAGGWLPTWWVAGGNADPGGTWSTGADVPGQRATGGLLAAYYDTPALAGGGDGPSAAVYGSPTSYTAVQGPIDFRAACNCTASWPYAGHGGPMPPSTGGGTAEGFAIKFLGWLYAPASGGYGIGCRADDACQVWVNGTLVADGMTGGGAAPNYYGACNACAGIAGMIRLKAGDWYPLELDYTQGGGGASVDLFWTPPGGAQADVPASDLGYPVLAGGQGPRAYDATLRWASNGNPAGTTYQLVQDRLSPAGALTGTSIVYQGTATTFTATDLRAESVTEYFVRAQSADGALTPFNTEPGGGGYEVADAPIPVVATPSAGSHLDVSWPDLGDGAHYDVIWSTESSFASVAGSGDLGAGVGGYTIGDLVPDTRYFVALQAWIPEPSGVGGPSCADGAGGGCWWTAASGGAWTLAKAPSQLQATGAGDVVSFSWNPNGNPSSTTYLWSVNPAGSPAAVATGSGTAAQASAAGLSCQSGYAVTVKAVNGAGVPTAAVQVSAETGICPPAPQAGLQIDNGLPETSSTAVTLAVTATDLSYPQSELQMRFSNAGGTWSAWQPYGPTAGWTIKGAAGPNTVYAQVRDPGGGVGAATATIGYAASPPSLPGATGAACSYRDLAAKCVQSPVITADFAMPAGAVSMEISFDNTDWSQPQDAAPSVHLVLPGGDGLKAVFARYFNRENVATAAGPDYFVLETAPPAVRVGWLDGAAVTDNGAATLVVQAADTVLPASALKVAISGAAAWSGPLPAGGEIPLTLAGSGYVTVTVTVRDPAGNAATATAGIYNP